MDQAAVDPVAKALAFAAGLRKNVQVAARRWSRWPGGAEHVATILACIDRVVDRIEALDELAPRIADLRSVLEWTTYQSATVSAARAVVAARRTRAFALDFGVLDRDDARMAAFISSEAALLENVRIKEGYMIALAQRSPHLRLPRPLIGVQSLEQTGEKKRGRLDFIQKLRKSAKKSRDT